MNPNPKDFHAHIYYSAAQERAAEALRKALAEQLDCPVGRMHDSAIGPHPKAMFQATIAPPQLGRVLSWLIFNRNGLDILIHPDTGEDLRNHTEQAVWLGQALALRLEYLSNN